MDFSKLSHFIFLVFLDYFKLTSQCLFNEAYTINKKAIATVIFIEYRKLTKVNDQGMNSFSQSSSRKTQS